jgi:hypothetical protein
VLAHERRRAAGAAAPSNWLSSPLVASTITLDVSCVRIRRAVSISSSPSVRTAMITRSRSTRSTICTGVGRTITPFE